MMKEFDMMILFVVEIVVVVDDDLMMLSMMNTSHYWWLTKICREGLETIFNEILLMDIDCLQLKLMKYHRDWSLAPLMNVFEEHWYIVHDYAILHDDFETKPR